MRINAKKIVTSVCNFSFRWFALEFKLRIEICFNDEQFKDHTRLWTTPSIVQRADNSSLICFAKSETKPILSTAQLTWFSDAKKLSDELMHVLSIKRNCDHLIALYLNKFAKNDSSLEFKQWKICWSLGIGNHSVHSICQEHLYCPFGAISNLWEFSINRDSVTMFHCLRLNIWIR